MRQGIKEKDIRDFEKYTQKLSNMVKRIREYNPEANVFLAMDYLNLMSCDFRQYPREEWEDYSVTSVHMEGFDGGDW